MIIILYAVGDIMIEKTYEEFTSSPENIIKLSEAEPEPVYVTSDSGRRFVVMSEDAYKEMREMIRVETLLLHARAQRNAGVKGMTIDEVRQRVDDRIREDEIQARLSS